MPLILNIETATNVCAIALANNGNLISSIASTEERTHAQWLTVFIEKILAESGYTFSQLDAIAVSKGPGSYTGLRIGVAVAKGLCYALDKPLLAVDTLQSMAFCAKEQLPENLVLYKDQLFFSPMIDARRMEVYTAIYNYELRQTSPVKALILEKDSFADEENRQLVFFGDGSSKFEKLAEANDKFHFVTDFKFSAIGMVAISQTKFERKEFEDVTYFEPFYLKEFAGVIPGNKV